MEVRLGVFLFLITLSTGLCQQDDYRLFVTDAGGMIYSFDLNMTFFHYDPLGVQIVGIAVDPSSTADNYILVISTIEENGQKYFIRRVIEHDPGFQTPENEIIFDSTPHNAFVDRLAIDGVSKNIYFTAVGPANSKTSFIGVLTPEGHFTKIVSQLDIPRDIELHPARRMFFYTDHGTSPKIGWSYMDGSAHGVLITTELTWPNGLAIDYAGDKLYWTDVYNKDVAQAKIESYDLNTGTRKIEARPGVHLMDILVDGAYYFYLSWSSTTITKARLSDNVIVHTFHASWGVRLDAMAVYSPQTRDLPGLYDCVERIGLGTCSTICLPSATGHSCKCPDGEECEGVVTCGPIGGGALSSTCNRYPDEMCDFSCYHGYSPITGGVFCSNSMWDISNPCLPYDSEGGDNYKMFVADSKGFVYSVNSEGQVVRVYDVKDHADETKLAEVKAIAVDAHATDADATLIYSVKDGIYKVPVDGSEAELILNTTTFGAFPAGLAIEPTSKNIYFTLAVPGNAGGSYVSILSPRGDHVGLVSGLITPRDIVLDISRSLMFWADSYEQFPYIGWAVMDGTSASLLITNQLTEMVSPHGLAIDTADDALYWTDASLGVIKRYSLTDTQITTVVSVPNSQLRDILIDGDLFFYSDLTENEVINTVRLSDVTDNTSFRINGAYKLVAMAMYSSNSRQLPGDTKCANREGRGDCSDVCLPGSQGQTCRCDNGKQLESNAKTCENAELCPATLSRGSLSDSCLKHDLEMCDFTCPSGFSPEVTQIKCEKQNWNNADPCKPDCNDLGSLGHGQIQRSNGNSHQSVATFTCNHGYVLKGSGTRKCQAGVWTNSNPVCEIIVCDVLSSPENGHLAAAGNEFMSEAKYTCNDGFDLRGAAEIICTITGHWSDSPPVCLAKECPEIDDPAGGKVEFSNYNIYRSVARFVCNEGYSLDGARSIECQANEQWSNDVPTCSRIVCPELTGFENGAIQLKDGHFYDSVATFSCNEGYLLNGGSSRRCEAIGWSGTTPSCERIVCPEIIGFENGVIQLEDEHFYDSVATFSCNEGYLLNGGSSRRCEAGGWSGATPSCERIVCPEIIGFEYGVIQLEDEHFYDSVATFSCNEGYLLNGGNSRRCEAGGWSGIMPSCERIVCPALSGFTNGDIHLEDEHFYHSVATFSCNEGYLLNGGSSRLCEAGGWSGTTPSCERIVCPELTGFENGDIQLEDEHFYHSVATFSCNEGYLLNGGSSRRCEARGWSGATPLCVRIVCPELIGFENGDIQLEDENFYDSVATFSCNEGYLLNGGSSRRCEAGGWSGATPFCDRIVCPELTGFENGDIQLEDENFYDSVATFSCNEGYLLNGGSSRRCEAGGWSGATPFCDRIVCPELTGFENGDIQLEDENFYDSVATFSCNEGYLLDGGSSRRCEAGGWSGATPFCERIVCPELTGFENGDIQLEDENFYDSVATFSCNEGYLLNGGSSRRCEAGGWSGATPFCDRIVCPELTVFENGDIQLEDENFYDSVATFSCNEGYLLNGGSSRRCEAGGWSGATPFCDRIVCPELTGFENGDIQLEDENFYDSVATFSCNEGYLLNGGSSRRCEAGGWSGATPFCERIAKQKKGRDRGNVAATPNPKPTESVHASAASGEESSGASTVSETVGTKRRNSQHQVCPELTGFENGDIQLEDENFYDSVATFSCNEGYLLNGGSSRRCEAGGWSGATPSCGRIVCPELTAFENGDIHLDDDHFYDSLATFSCNEGYLLNGGSSRRCEAGGWSGATPSCERIVCPELTGFENGDIQLEDERFYDSVATFSCYEGYILNGGSSRRCEVDGWSGITPSCEQVVCDELSSPDNGHVDAPGQEFMMVATYICNDGFDLHGSDKIMCTSSGQWDDSPPVCLAKECPEISNPAGGQVEFSNTNMYHSVASFSCNEGYLLDGARSLECLANEQWSDDVPTCRQIVCEELSSPDNGQVDASGHEFMAVATYICNDGFDLHGSAEMMCTVYGQWSDSPPVCLAKDCGDPAIDNSQSFGSTKYGGYVTIYCNDGYIGGGRIACPESGVWESRPTCAAVDCADQQTSIDNGYIFGTTTYQGSAEVICAVGHKGGGAAICEYTGLWQQPLPTCSPVECPEIGDPADGHVEFSDNNMYRSVARFSCNKGYLLDGAGSIECQANEQWSNDVPICTQVECPEPEHPYNANVSYPDGQELYVGRRVQFDCHTGYERKGGPRRIECLPDFTWHMDSPYCSLIETTTTSTVSSTGTSSTSTTGMSSQTPTESPTGSSSQTSSETSTGTSSQTSTDSPTGTPSSTPVCPEPEHPDNADVSYPHGRELFVGRRVQFDCHAGYERKGGPRRIECLSDLTWHKNSPYCILIETTTTSTVSSTGTSSTSNTDTSSQAPTESPTGSSSQTSSETSTDTSSQTSTDASTGTPSSTPVCQEPEHPDNADVSYPDGPELYVGRRVQFDCHAGYERKGGPRRIECLPDLTWHTDTPYCILIETTTASTISSTGTSSTSNTGSSSQTSSETSTGTPSSTPVCQEPEHPDNADVSYPDGRELFVGRRVQFDCHAGYERKGGPRRIECLSDLTWHKDSPYCTLIETTTTSTVSSTGTSPTSTSTEPHTGTSSQTSTDSPSGTSSQTAADSPTDTSPQTSTDSPTGTPSSSSECHALSAPEHGIMSLTDNFLLGSTASFECEAVYTLQGPMSIICKDDGSWTGDVPVCQRIVCPKPQPPDHCAVSYPDGEDLYVDRRVQFDCYAGYERKGPRRIWCQRNATWTKEPPTCYLPDTTATSSASTSTTSSQSSGTTGSGTSSSGLSTTAGPAQIASTTTPPVFTTSNLFPGSAGVSVKPVITLIVIAMFFVIYL